MISLQQAPIKFVLHFVSISWKEVIKMELFVSLNLDLSMKSSAIADEWRVKLVPNGMSFFYFSSLPLIFKV